MKSTQIFYRLIAIAFLLLPAGAKAEGLYVIGAVGSASEFTYINDPEVDGSIGHMFGFGKYFGESLAIELFHANPAASEATYPRSPSPLSGLSIDSNLTTVGLAFKWHFNLSDTNRGYLKFGYHSWDIEHKETENRLPPPTEDSGSDVLWGLGVEFQSNATLAWIVGYDSYSIEGFSNNADHLYFGAKFSF